MKEDLHIVKVGGKIMNNSDLLDDFLHDFARMSGKKILVHGGGSQASELADKLGVENTLINGRRITSSDNLEIVVMVYAGLLNKRVVAKLQHHNVNALGLSGADMNVIKASRRVHPEIDYGEVGDIESSGVNTAGIQTLIANGVTPVFCAITHDGKGNLFNTNADTIASTLAIALSESFSVKVTFCFEHNGVLRDKEDPDSWIKKLRMVEYQELVASKVVSDGMLPKLDNAFNVLEYVNSVNIKNSTQLNSSSGTELIKD